MQFTLADVSQRFGVTIADLSRIENGLADPRLSTRGADAVGSSLSDVTVPRVFGRTLSASRNIMP
jgi:transcriptional regulator with XRE-family HTH domain